ncbi:anthranilate synthase component II [Corynebacterium sp. zg912]|uniref:anthranilate synthase n=1 Tax=Corynebacterium wankanglinii TaxID=2735136 RepID=A0A7H0KA10_9CORY|nr:MULTISPECIES: gamma-glutamyl-gamma-aminobutyrate hydrolase family protein [Corynebacterium]MBA1836551.1 C26 family cysteine hydrolase domain-containing family [Corynebacterium wankanglinii]MCR5928550.1 anthranilate synthase component II [Corynebacterium sp. zg912]QNP94126.1 gamma-glutamyl-gamma-aminobutyrate hydrolase family protein [Corynebacterium wankanglinii]
MIVLLDNQDSFVYNLVDALAGYDTVVYRNTVPADTVLDGGPELIVLSPGPGYPADAGCMMEVIARAQGRIPILGICLGYQALIEHFGGRVEPCGPEHGTSVPMRLTGPHPLFDGLTVGGTPGQPGLDVPVARYHSLGAVAAPEGIVPLAWTDTEIGGVIMAAETADGMSVGFQFHPESILTPSGPQLLERCVEQLLQKGRDNG